jgi:hypothetical protein
MLPNRENVVDQNDVPAQDLTLDGSSFFATHTPKEEENDCFLVRISAQALREFGGSSIIAPLIMGNTSPHEKTVEIHL